MISKFRKYKTWFICVFVICALMVISYLMTGKQTLPDIFSNIAGGIAGGVFAVWIVFIEIDSRHRDEAQISIIKLLNLIDEFSFILPEKDRIRELYSNNYDNTFYEHAYHHLVEFNHEFHILANEFETKVIGINRNVDLTKILKQINVIQYDLDE
ncbi:MAG: hypothetical protein K6F18_02010 [Lactobacillus sp.]|nr:hypothetical protein [Lactobacillus sp.]